MTDNLNEIVFSLYAETKSNSQRKYNFHIKRFYTHNMQRKHGTYADAAQSSPKVIIYLPVLL